MISRGFTRKDGDLKKTDAMLQFVVCGYYYQPQPFQIRMIRVNPRQPKLCVEL